MSFSRDFIISGIFVCMIATQSKGDFNHLIGNNPSPSVPASNRVQLPNPNPNPVIQPRACSVRLYKKKRYQGKPKIQWTDENGGCRTIPPPDAGHVASIDTFDLCVILWSSRNCSGEAIRLSRYEYGTRNLDLVSYKNASSIQICPGVDQKDPNPGPRPKQQAVARPLACSVRLYRRIEFRGPSIVHWTDDQGNCTTIKNTTLIQSIDTFDLCIILWSNADCTGLPVRLSRYTYGTRNLREVRILNYVPKSIQICQGVDKPDPNPGPRPVENIIPAAIQGSPSIQGPVSPPFVALACSVRLYKRVEFRGKAHVLWTDENGGCRKIPQFLGSPRKIRSIDTFDLCVVLWFNDDCTGESIRLSRYSYGSRNLKDIGIPEKVFKSIQICQGVDKPDPNPGPRPNSTIY